LRVALCHHYSLTHGGGGERILTDVANYLSTNGHEVGIYALPFRKQGAKLNLRKDVTYTEGFHHRFKADVAYHIYAPLMPNLFRSRAPRIAGLHGAVVADYDGNPADFLKQGPFVAGAYVFRELLGRRALRGFDAIHTVNGNSLPINHPNVYRIPNWVDCSHSVDLVRARRDREDKFRILFVGKPYYIKGFDRFLALSKLIHEDDIEFVATFPPENLGYGGNHNVRYIGYVPNNEIWNLYRSGGLLLHPTRKETFGIVILESLVSGLPVLTTPIPCHSGMKLPLKYASTMDGFIREVKNVYQTWKNDYDTYLKYAEAGVDAVKHYDRKLLLPQFERMLAEVAARRTRP